MLRRCWLVLGLILFANISTFSRAEEPQSEPLWPAGAPSALGSEPKDVPRLIHYRLSESASPTSAVVVCPGGGYGGLAMDHEGHQIAQWLNKLGVSAFILDYRHRGKGYGHPAPLQDAQRAIRTVRARAAEWNIAPNQIGILGFSAGGHLASSAATHFDSGDEASQDLVERTSCRPDFQILCYPVILFGHEKTHNGSQRNLIGADADAELVRHYSNEQQVTAETPPAFLFHTDEDSGVPPENSVLYYLALKKHNVPAELHVFEKGRHGLGLAAGTPGTEMWSKACEVWLRNHGWVH